MGRVTLLEVHLDGDLQVGPRTLGDRSDGTDEETAEEASSGGPARLLLGLTLLAAVVIAALAIRSRLGAEEPDEVVYEPTAETN